MCLVMFTWRRQQDRHLNTIALRTIIVQETATHASRKGMSPQGPPQIETRLRYARTTIHNNTCIRQLVYPKGRTVPRGGEGCKAYHTLDWAIK